MSFSRYPKYKPSGVKWLGEVPAHWSVEPFKRQIERNDGGVWGGDPDGVNDTIVLRSTEQTVDGRWQLDDPAPRKLSASDITAALLIEGDLLLTKSSGSSLHIGKTTLVTAGIAAMRCCYSNFMQRIRTRQTLLPKLAWHVLNNELARRQFDLLSNSTTGLANLNGTMVGQLLVPVPPLAEQTRIAEFLDRETAKIDELVAEQRQLMGLLKEKRQAVISHAVTRGLNPQAPLKPSGIEWLGDVPTHWEVGPLKRYWSVTDCKHVTAEFVEDGIPLASIREVQSRWVTLENAKRTTEYFYEQLIECGREPLPGDLIFSRNATVGEVAQVRAEHPKFAMGQDVVLLRKLSPKYSSDFLQHVIRSPIIIRQLDNMMIGSTFKRINVEEIRSFMVPLPPSTEQEKISSFLESETAKLNTLTTEAQRAIDLLQERRTALISAAVTGQIDVRHVAAPAETLLHAAEAPTPYGQ